MKNGRAFLLLFAFAVSFCGDTPSEPSAALNLAGNWTGTWTFVSGGATVSDAVTMTVSQNGTVAGGQWSAAGGAAGNVQFSPAADFTGTANISQTLIIGGNCSASTTISGTATSNQIRITYGTLAPTGLCQWSASNQFTFTR